MTVQKIVATEKHDCDHLLGQFLDESHYDVVIDSDTDFYIPAPCSAFDTQECSGNCAGCPTAANEDRVGFVFRKNYFTVEEQVGAYAGLHKAAEGVSNNRGLASGPKVEKVGNRDWLTACQDEILTCMAKGKTPLPGFDPIQEILDKYKDGDKETTRGCMWLYHATRKDNFDFNTWLVEARKLSITDRQKEALRVEKQYVSISTYASPVNSGVAGAFDPYPRYPYARLTAYNRNHADVYPQSFPFLQKLSEGFQKFLPQRYSNQKKACEQVDHRFVIPETVFTTLTINKTFQTAAHLDAGDLEVGFSNLSVITDGVNNYTGGYLVLPEYRAAINIRPGDLLLIANHNVIHGNTPIDGKRISIVAYFREKLIGTGSLEYNEARFDYVEMRKDDPILSEGRNLYNGVNAGMWQEQRWYDFCIERIGKEETYKMHPEAAPSTAGSLEGFFGD